MILRGLHVKLALIVAAGALILASLSSWWFYSRSYQDSINDSERSVKQLLATVEVSAAIAAYVGNTELAQQVVQGLIQNDIVLGAKIHNNAQFAVLAGKFTESTEASIVTLELFSPFTPGELIGELAITPNRALIEKRANESARATTMGLAMHTFVVAFLVLVAVYLMLTRPLVRLSTGLHRIVPGEKERLNEFSEKRRDEIGTLASDINHLLDTVENMLVQERGLRERVEALEQRFRGIFEATSAGIFLLRESGTLVTANPAFFRITGKPESELLQQQVNCINQVFAEPAAVMSIITLAMQSRRPYAADFCLAPLPDGETRWVHGLLSSSGQVDGATLIEGVIYDITERKRAEESSRYLAEYDQLTGLLNRHSGELRLAEQMADAEARGEPLAVMVLDLDRFKEINDTYGHNAGDNVLVTIANRIRTVIRSTDLVARLGGDEFLLTLAHSEQLETLHRVARKLVDVIGQELEVVENVREKVGASIGIATFPEHGQSWKQLSKNADDAMYAVKRRGRNGYAIFDENGNHQVHIADKEAQL